MTSTEGWTAPGWEGVRDAFDENFEQGLEVGAAFSAYHRGEKVVDLWGGVADPETDKPWMEDTLMLVYSTTKGVTAMCANKLAQEGKLDVDAPVVEYWPEFGKHGKGDIPVSHLLSHQAGLAWVDGELTLEEALSWGPMIEALEEQRPSYVPGSQHGYHATTYGWLVGEVIRRVAGRSVGTYLHDEVAGPLGADFWIGLPAPEDHRAGRLVPMFPTHIKIEDLHHPGDDPVLQMIAAFVGPQTDLGKALGAPSFVFADQDVWNSTVVRAAEIPAANGVGDARSLARLYGACVSEVDGIRLLTPDQVDRAVTQRTSGPNTVLLGLDIQFGLGFMLNTGVIQLGGPRSFGHFGAGGSVGWADPDAELGIGYVMNRMDIGLSGDLRSGRLVQACYRAIA